MSSERVCATHGCNRSNLEVGSDRCPFCNQGRLLAVVGLLAIPAAWLAAWLTTP